MVPDEVEETPSANDLSPPPNDRNGSLKRRQSSISSNASKRPRLSVDANGDSFVRRSQASPRDARGPVSDRAAPVRKTSLQANTKEDRQRGKRLFGAVLGTLSQRGTTAAQKRRADIEKKQQAKLKMQAEEDELARNERLEELRSKRRKEQVIWDEAGMRIRHSSMLASAKFLRTETEPRLVCISLSIICVHAVLTLYFTVLQTIPVAI